MRFLRATVGHPIIVRIVGILSGALLVSAVVMTLLPGAPFGPHTGAWAGAVASAGYLCGVATIYWARLPIPTRGGIVRYEEKPQEYWIPFVFLVTFGLLCLFVALLSLLD